MRPDFQRARCCTAERTGYLLGTHRRMTMAVAATAAGFFVFVAA
jgi:hypothetical protein